MKLFARFILFFVLSFLSIEMQAQYDRYFYEWSDQTSFDEVTTKVPGEVIFKEWESNSFLFEYHITVGNVPRSTFLALLKAGRYDLKKEMKGSQLHLFLDGGSFRKLITDSGQADEDLILTIYYPEEFEESGDQLIRK